MVMLWMVPFKWLTVNKYIHTYTHAFTHALCIDNSTHKTDKLNDGGNIHNKLGFCTNNVLTLGGGERKKVHVKSRDRETLYIHLQEEEEELYMMNDGWGSIIIL